MGGNNMKCNNESKLIKQKFSVLMSVYDKENSEYFDLALNSILISQTRIPDEFVLVVDGPVNDELQNVIKRYKEMAPNILHVYTLKNNRGLGYALNYGLEKCTNNIIARADSDDICAPNRFEIQIRKFEDNNKLDVLGSFIEEFNEDQNIIINKKQVPLTSSDILKMAKFRNPINHMTVVFKKDKIIECGSYIHIPYLEDYYLWVRAIHAGYHLENVNKYLVHARIGNGMIKRRGNKEYIKSWSQLNSYMISVHMINKFEYVRNMISVYVFIFMPTKFKEIAYKYILRNNDNFNKRGLL